MYDRCIGFGTVNIDEHTRIGALCSLLQDFYIKK